MLVEDSKNLPPDWKDHNLEDLIKRTDQVPADGDATNDEVVYILEYITDIFKSLSVIG